MYNIKFNKYFEQISTLFLSFLSKILNLLLPLILIIPIICLISNNDLSILMLCIGSSMFCCMYFFAIFICVNYQETMTIIFNL